MLDLQSPYKPKWSFETKKFILEKMPFSNEIFTLNQNGHFPNLKHFFGRKSYFDLNGQLWLYWNFPMEMVIFDQKSLFRPGMWFLAEFWNFRSNSFNFDRSQFLRNYLNLTRNHLNQIKIISHLAWPDFWIIP